MGVWIGGAYCLIERVYYWLCGFTLDIRDFVKKWPRKLGIASMMLLTLAALAICLKSEWLIITLSVISSITALVAWYFGNTFAAALNITPVGATTVEKITKEIKKLLFPICTLSLILAFLAFWVGVNGVEALYTRTFLVIFLAVFFAFIAMVYFGKETRYAGKAMTALVIFMLLQWGFPEQYRWLNRAVYSSSQYAGSATDRYSLNRQADALATFAIVREDTILYDSQNQATTISVQTGQTVLVVKIKADLPEENSGMTEPLVQVVLQDQYGNFVNPSSRTIYKVPRSKLSKYMVASSIYDDPYIKLPKIIILTKKGEVGGTLPFKEDTTVIITVKGGSSLLKFPNGGWAVLSVGSRPYSAKKGEKLYFEGNGDYGSIITVSN